MSLTEEQRELLVQLYLGKSDEALVDAEVGRKAERWNFTANRLYYAMFHAVTALLVRDGYDVKSHEGAKINFGKYYVMTNLATPEEGRFYSQMITLRERADYDCVFLADKDTIDERFPQVERFIHKIRTLIDRKAKS